MALITNLLGKKFQVLVECSEQTTRFKEIKSLGLFTEMYKPQNAYAAIKSANALLYVLGKQFAQLNKFDEVLIQNHENHWIEACSSNLFLIQDEVIMAPKYDSGCVWGVSRDFLVNLFDVKFVDVTEDLLYQADEIFLSNGIQWVQSVQYFNEKPLKNTQTLQIIENIKAELSI
jgi:branched-subunit amino acid aminotransferase/4-amino-4-deoxychorismate lyase